MIKLENLIKKIDKQYENLTFDLSSWDYIIDSSSNASIYYQRSLVDYYAAYYEGTNISFVLRENNSVIAIFPLLAYKKDGNWFLTVNGEGLLAPLFSNTIPKKLRKRLEKEVIEVINLLAEGLKIKKITFFEASSKVSDWYLSWLDKAKKDFLIYQLAIDLNQDIEEIRLNFRKSYKPLVNKALKEWNVEVCDKTDDSSFEEFKTLHFEVSGRQTRSDETWEIQKQQLNDKEAFLITVRDKEILIGAGLFNYSKYFGMYSVGAYKRELFHKPIGHAVQMKAIERLKELGCRTYYLGKRATSLYASPSTEKETSISHFKEGFANNVYIQPHIEISF